MKKSAKNKLIMPKKLNSKKDNTQVMKSKNEDLFLLVKNEENKVKIVVGKYVVCNKSFESFKQAEDYIATKPYEIIFNLAALAAKTNYEYEKANEKQINENAESVK